jgi:lysophospholipase L1-like esterase
MGRPAQTRHAAAALFVVLLALAVCALAAPGAHALAARFAVESVTGYERGFRITVGDDGRTPYFRPGVVVWDGGSIMSGHGADPGYEFPTQTLAVVPRVCTSYVSATGNARIGDMIREAPREVDAHHDGRADLNVCLVLAGGGDFRDGVSAAQEYSSLKTYCRARRAAGFRVLVLTVLPCGESDAFEATRLAYDAMVRNGWSSFADGLVDIAADPRIGDTGDDLDGQYYQEDRLHLTSAGYSVMAAAAAPVLGDQPWTSKQVRLRVRDAAADWGPWRPWTARTRLWLGDYQGTHVVEAEYQLGADTPVAVSDSVFVDTVRPVPRVLRAAVARRGKKAKLRYQVDDALPCGPTGTVIVAVKTPSGRTLRTFVQRGAQVNEPLSVTFACTLPKGYYRWTVSARDTAGNTQLTPADGALRVR